MKKIKFLSLITLFTLTFSLISCGGGGGGGSTPTEDTTKPVATDIVPATDAIIEINGNSEGVIEFSAKLADNENLASYSIDIHQNTPGHVDPKSTITRSIGRVPFSYSQNWSVSGKTASVKQSIKIEPINNQAIQVGSYHFVLTVTDAAGNHEVYINEIILKDEI